MGLISRLMGRETRSASVKTSDSYLAEFFGLRSGGGNVTPDNVLSSIAVAARCVAIRSELMASTPRHLYRRDENGGRERATDNPLYGVLHDTPNPNQSGFEFWEFMYRCLDLHGNSYARIERNARGEVTALYPILPLAVGVERLASGRLRYRISDPRGGGTTVLLQEEVLHIRGATRDGVLGLSPIAIARGSLALAMAQADAAAALMANGLRPSGAFTYPERLNAEQKGRLRGLLEDGFAGQSNAGRFFILDGGAKFEPLAWSPEDGEFLATRKLANEDVARIFGLPPTVVGITDRATYSNAEHEGRALVQNALGPLASRVEAAIHRCLLTEGERRTYYAEHDLSGLLRGDVEARFKAYRLGREIGLFSANDLARLENLPPIEGGEVRYVPANWMRLGETASQNREASV